MKHKVFVYGNLMEGMPLYREREDLTILGEGTIRGTMYYANFPRVLLGGIDAGLVQGEVHEVSDQILREFDMAECIHISEYDPTWYARQRCTVTMKTGVVYPEVFVYAPVEAGKTWKVISHGSYRQYIMEASYG